MSRDMEARLESFIASEGRRALEIAYRWCGDREEAEDLVQEALRRIAANADRYDPTRSLEAWFFVILRNIFLDSRKRVERQNRVSLDAIPEATDGAQFEEILPDGTEDHLERLEREETAAEVRRALGAMTGKQRAVLILCDVEGLEYGAIARNLDMPPGTVRSSLFRARKTLKTRLSCIGQMV